MVKEVTRYVKRELERELWARAAGRCQFSGCNKPLYVSSVTNETINQAQKAHIYSFSEKGPRGRGPFKLGLTSINDISNLMLLCHECHVKIDSDKKGQRYSADLLIQWKAEHEHRVEIVTGISSDKKSHTVLYGANIGSERSPINYHSCIEAMFLDVRRQRKWAMLFIGIKERLASFAFDIKLRFLGIASDGVAAF